MIYLYLYMLGFNNQWDRITTPTPYEINRDELFFGPCKRTLRQDLRVKFLGTAARANINSTDNEIYVVGINPVKMDHNNEPRLLLFAAKIKELFTFECAWDYYNDRAKSEERIKEMINKIDGSLHLKPVKHDDRKGYSLNNQLHIEDWIYDLLSNREIELYKKLNNLKLPLKEFRNYIHKNIKEILKDEENGIIFERDCCFSATNYFSRRDEQDPIIPFDNELINLIRDAFKIQHKNNRLSINGGPNLSAPFGYTKNNSKYGRGFLILEGTIAKQFINHICDKLKTIDSC